MSTINLNHNLSIRTYKNITPKLGERVFVDPAAVVVGNVTLGEDCSIWPCAVIRGDIDIIRIGNRTNIQDGSILHVSDHNPLKPDDGALFVGDDVTIGHGVNLHGCTINHSVIVGIGSIVLDGAVIESNVILGAGSLVPPGKTLKSGFIYMGSPCQALRKLNKHEIASIVESAQHYVNTKNTFI